MDAALRYLTPRPRTVRELEEHLDRAHYGEYEIAQAVERLLELRYLDDAAYARDFIRSRLATKPVSRRKLMEQLISHKLPRDVAAEALEAVTDEVEAENAAAVAEKFARQFAALPEAERKRRVARRLFSHGYGYDAARAAMRRLEEELDEDEYGALDGMEDDMA